MEEPILSVDDLVFKIGALVVEKMELEKKLANIAKIEEEYKGALVREQDLRRQLEELAKRYNQIVEQLNQERLKVNELQKELEVERSRRMALEGKLDAYSHKGKKRD
jgi:septal ring factor EnvC (AmiA/AmiB activator)